MGRSLQHDVRFPRPGDFLLCLSLLFTLAVAAFAEPIKSLKPTGFVNDFANVLSPDTRDQLERYCYQVQEKTEAQIAVVTVNSLDGEDVEGYANKLFRQWGVGDKKEKRGILILLAVKDRKYRFEVGYGLEPILPDGKVGGFGREGIPYLKAADYDSAVRLWTKRVGSVITGEDDSAQDAATAPVEEAPPSSQIHERPSAGTILVGIIIVIFLLSTRTGRSILFWWLLFGGGRGGGGSSWGGGSSFGGGDSGGGFSGFGGGDSGGGGASGSW